jgi:O-antigen/teichoic acid export membrane protein
MELGSILSYVLLIMILGVFVVGLLSNFFFPFFMEENDELNKKISLEELSLKK